MRRFIAVLLLSSTAFAVDYSVGRVKPLRYSVPSVTVACGGTGFSTTCSGYDSSKPGAIYRMTFADGTSRLIEHVPFTRDPLKSVNDETPVQYRIWHHTGVDYVHILDSKGKEGAYMFSTRDDDPKRPAKVYGPAPVPAAQPSASPSTPSAP